MNHKLSIKTKENTLYNLMPSYAKFKSNYPDIKVGFSIFCVHRPKWCIAVGVHIQYVFVPSIKMLS